MSQQQSSPDLDLAPEGSPHPCQCSAMSSVDSVRAQRDKIERGLINTRQDHPPRVFEGIPTAFIPIRRNEMASIVSGENQQLQINQIEQGSQLQNSSPRSPSNNPGSVSTRRVANAPCSPRNLDLSRNLAFEAARKVHESSSSLSNENQRNEGSSPSSPSPMEPKDLEKSDQQTISQKQTTTGFLIKDKVKNVQQILSPYQHNHEQNNPTERNLHGQFHVNDSHLHKHGDNYRGTVNLDGNEAALMAFQRQQHHSHHHHVSPKISNVNHHHPHPQSIIGHHHVNAGAVFNDPLVHHHGNSGPLSAATSSNSSLINHPHGNSPSVIQQQQQQQQQQQPQQQQQQHLHVGGNQLPPSSMISHHHASSGLSSESSSSNANVRTHSRLDHVHDLHHNHHQQQQAQNVHSHPGPMPEARQRTPSSLEHHPHHHGHIHNHSHTHGNQSSSESKSVPLIGVGTMQQVNSPAKSKCQCHVVQHEDDGNKRGSEDECDDSEMTSRTHQPPALPPRPPPRPTRHYATSSSSHRHSSEGGCCKKYVVLCCLCGGLSAAVGSLFLAVHAILSSNTASLALFETVPSYIPGTMLILMGLFTMLLARRKLRYGLLMKVCGSVGVVCALVCVLVTVTTTVVHMSRLQGLRECVYTARARSCTCYGTPQSRGDPGVLFEGTPHCEAVHGALYACLRALFGVSVAGILACIFSCMLVYQLLSHEKKKMYWEQLELRCRSLYGQGGSVGQTTGSCGCCNDCGGASPWWAQTPGNLYTPNPDLAPARRWRLPWSRSRGPAPSPDSNYGFHAPSRQVESNVEPAGPYSVLNSQNAGPYSVLNAQNGPYTPSTASYSVLETPVPLWGPPPPYSDPNSPARRPQVPEPRPRLAKRLENYEGVNDDHRPRATKRSSGNYENAEEISNSTDPEGGNEGTMKGRRTRKPLKGVENGAFQQEPTALPKQSESELYFGDVSSCCGPESSFYDLAVDKDGVESAEGIDYLAARLGKRQLSKRSRLPLPLPADGVDTASDSYANSDEPRNVRGPFLAPDAQYEVIQQGRYAYYTPRVEETNQESPTASGYFRDEQFSHAEEPERERVRVAVGDREYREEETPQCCLSDSTTLDSGWQSGDQPQSDDSVRPVNV